MKVDCISSGSKGNAYLVNDGSSLLLLECGVSFKAIQKATKFRTSAIVGCLITHEHKDHSKCANDLYYRGIRILATRGTLDAISLSDVKEITKGETFEIGSYLITAFSIEHDCKEPVGFIIHSTASRETMLYVTDTCYIRYDMSKIEFSHIMIEANHDRDMIIDNVMNKKLHLDLAKRILKNHMSIDTCISTLNSLNLKHVKEIDLIHLSDSNSNAAEFKEKVQKATGCYVKVF